MTQSVHVIIVNNEGEIEGEVDEGPEQRFRHQEHKVPHVVRQIVDLWSKEKAIKAQILPEFSDTRFCGPCTVLCDHRPNIYIDTKP